MTYARKPRDELDRIARLEEMVRLLRLNHSDTDMEVISLTDYVTEGWDGSSAYLVRNGRMVMGAGGVLWDPARTTADAAVANATKNPKYDARYIIATNGNLVGINTPRVTLGAGVLLPPNFCPSFGIVAHLTCIERDPFAEPYLLRTYVSTDGTWDVWDSDTSATHTSWIPASPVDSDGNAHHMIPTFRQTGSWFSIEGIMWIAGEIDSELMP